MRKVAYFSAGLGDVIRNIYINNAYEFISSVDERVDVVCASHNPFTIEIFKFHNNAKNFVIYDLAHKYNEYYKKGIKGSDLKKAVLDFIDINDNQILNGSVGKNFKPQFNAPDDIDSSGHIVFQPFAGDSGRRTFKPHLIDNLLKILRKVNCKVYLISRDYIREGANGSLAHYTEDAKMYEGGNIVALNNLSVPATINLVKSSLAYVGSWSSMQQAAWFENKPVAVFYPVAYPDVVKRNGYAFGLDRTNCFHSDYDNINFSDFEDWVTEVSS